MKKKNRILKNDDFEAIIRHGSVVKSDALFIYYRPQTSEHFKVGIAVSKKIGNAVTRNLIKRRIKAALAPLAKNLTKDYIIVAKKRVTDLTFPDLATLITTLIMKTENN